MKNQMAIRGLVTSASKTLRYVVILSVASSWLAGCDASSVNSSSSLDSSSLDSISSSSAISRSSAFSAEQESSSLSMSADASSSAGTSSSIFVSSSSSVVTASSNSEASSSEPAELGPIVARTSCPSAPPENKDVQVPGPFDLDIAKDDYAAMLIEMPIFDGTRGSLPWHMYQPDDAIAKPDADLPLIISLHGGYGREGFNHHILQDGVPYMLASSNGLLTPENRAKYPAYIIFPWCRNYAEFQDCPFYSNEWSSSGGANYFVQSQPSVNGQTLIELIEHVLATFNIDPARVYVTGVSMGGGGTWELAQRRPDLIAAAVPLAGHTPSQQFLNTFADSKVPIWAHGSTADNNNPLSDTVRAVDYIDGIGGCSWVTQYQGIPHDHTLWQRIYLNPDLWPWLFSQKQPRLGDPQ